MKLHVISTEPKESIGQKLAELRGQLGFTQAEFASRIGCGLRTYISWERGTANPPISVLRVLSADFRVDANWLLGIAGQPLDAARTLFDWKRFRSLVSEVSLITKHLNLKYPAEAIMDLVKPIFDGPREHDREALRILTTHLQVAARKSK
jgi:transcriptional regulator with XRE-family HTH domain